MQDGKRDGCWFMTIGHVYYQDTVAILWTGGAHLCSPPTHTTPTMFHLNGRPHKAQAFLIVLTQLHGSRAESIELFIEDQAV